MFFYFLARILEKCDKALTTELETSILFQTPLGAQLGLGTQPFYEAIKEIIDKMNWLELLA